MDGKAILPALLSDQLFNQFDAAYWSTTQNKEPAKFTEKAFPALATYYLGGELDKLVERYRWLNDLAVPSKRLKSARIFQRNPARNLGILEVFIKLQFLKIWGSAMMQRDPFCCICSEMFKIIKTEQQAEIADIFSHWPEVDAEHEPRRDTAGKYASIIEDQHLHREVAIVQQDFGDQWKTFVEKNEKKYWTSVNAKTFSRLYYTQTSWLSRLPSKSGLCKEAMSALLDSNADAYGTHCGGFKDIAVCWNLIKEYDGGGIRSDREFPQLLNLMIQKLWEAWIEITSDMVREKSGDRTPWVELSNNIWSFCIATGCSKADKHNPFDSLDMLRDLISRQFAYTAGLHNKISELNEEIILHQRMITALAYRYIIENISTETPGNNATEKWEAFVEKMFRNVEADDGKIPDNNPFSDLFDQHKVDKKYPLKYLKQTAGELYSSLSRTIHFFQSSKGFDQYTPMRGQFDPVQIDFMAAMNPKFLNDDRIPIWEEERKRYPGQVHDVGARVKPAKHKVGAKKRDSFTESLQRENEQKLGIFGLTESNESSEEEDEEEEEDDDDDDESTDDDSDSVGEE